MAFATIYFIPLTIYLREGIAVYIKISDQMKSKKYQSLKYTGRVKIDRSQSAKWTINGQNNTGKINWQYSFQHVLDFFNKKDISGVAAGCFQKQRRRFCVAW